MFVDEDEVEEVVEEAEEAASLLCSNSSADLDWALFMSATESFLVVGRGVFVAAVIRMCTVLFGARFLYFDSPHVSFMFHEDIIMQKIHVTAN